MKENLKTNPSMPFQLRVNSFENYYIKTSARCWCKTDEFWEVYWEQLEAIKKTLAINNIKLAIPMQSIEQIGIAKK